MDKEIRNIFESYQKTWDLTPAESFKRDKEFFKFVIESNPHLAPLRNIKLKYIFELYDAKLRQNIELDAPGLITENTNITEKQAFDILQEATKNVSDQEAYEGVKAVFESICGDILIYGSDIILEQSYRDTATQQRIDKKKQGALRHLSPQQYRNVPDSLRSPNKPVDPQSGQGVFGNVPQSMRAPAPAAPQRQGIEGYAGPQQQPAVSDAEKVTVTLKSGEKVGGVPTGKPAAQGMTQIKLDSGQVAAFPENVIERPGAAPTGATADAEKVTVTLKSGEKVGGVPTGKPAAQGMTQIKLDNGRVFAFSDDVIERPGTETIKTDVEVKAPLTGPGYPTADAIKLQQAERQLGTQASQIKDLETAASTPRAAEIQQQQQIKDIQAKNDQLNQRIQDMEAAEKDMIAADKAKSDQFQQQLQASMEANNKFLQKMMKTMVKGGSLADRMGAIHRGETPPAKPPAETVSGSESETVTTPYSKDTVSATETETEDPVKGSAPTIPKPGLKSFLGGAWKGAKDWAGKAAAKAAPTVAGLAGGVAGGLLGGAPGAMAGGALGKSLGAMGREYLQAPKGDRLRAALRTPDKMGHATQGALLGLGTDVAQNYMDPTQVQAQTIDDVSTTVAPPGTGGAGMDYSDTVDVNSPEYQASMQQYAPEAEVEVADQVDVEEAPYGVNPNTGEPLPEPRGQVKGGQRLMNMARR